MSHASPAGRAPWRDMLLDGWFVGRALLAADLLSWTFVLLLPGSTFAGSTGYAAFAAVASESAWAVFCGVGGAVCASALWFRATGWRTASAFVAAGVQSTIAYHAWLANGLSTATGNYALWALLGCALVFRNRAAPAADQVPNA